MQKERVERDLAPDVLRGFALLGIIVVNVAYFATNVDLGVTAENLPTTADAVTVFLMTALAQGKFYLLFSFLFGYSSHYVVKGGSAGVRRWVARAVALMLLGLAHVALFFIGDILFVYGLLGLLLTLFLFRSSRTIVLWAKWIYAVSVVLFASLVALIALGELFGVAGPAVEASRYGSLVATAGFVELIPARFELWLSDGVFILAFQGALVFVAFLLGLVAGRSGVLAGIGGALPHRRLLLWGLGLGLPLQLASAGVWLANELSPERSETVALGSFFFGFLTAPLLSAGYVGLLVFTLQRMPGLVTWLAGAGRLSLTVYLSQSVLLSLLFSGWGLGLYQQLPYWATVLIALAVAFGLSGLALLWVRHVGQGPMERLLSAWSKFFAGKTSSPTAN